METSGGPLNLERGARPKGRNNPPVCWAQKRERASQNFEKNRVHSNREIRTDSGTAGNHEFRWQVAFWTFSETWVLPK
jgi:hypothetical protein